eukprot:1381367-Prymnesium_polylepis.1
MSPTQRMSIRSNAEETWTLPAAVAALRSPPAVCARGCPHRGAAGRSPLATAAQTDRALVCAPTAARGLSSIPCPGSRTAPRSRSSRAHARTVHSRSGQGGAPTRAYASSRPAPCAASPADGARAGKDSACLAWAASTRRAHHDTPAH